MLAQPLMLHAGMSHNLLVMLGQLVLLLGFHAQLLLLVLNHAGSALQVVKSLIHAKPDTT
jgi:hypothetical protein